jgi:hypothetical protein
MKKGAFCELILRDAIKNGLLTTDDSKRISIRQVAAAADQIYADVIYLMIKDNESIDYFTKSYVAPIKKDTTTREYYVELDPEIVQLPNNAGVHVVKGAGSNRKFYPVTYGTLDLMDDMSVSNYYDRNVYVMDGQKKLIIKKFDYASQNITEVIMKLVVRFSEYGMDEEISLPSGKITEVSDMLAKKLFQNKKFLDTSSDGNSN